MSLVIKGNLSLVDLEKTSAETRVAAASNWEGDWYKVVEDMHHCCQFVLRDELADLLADGLDIVNKDGRLTTDEKREWSNIIAGVKAVKLNKTGSQLEQMAAFPVTVAALMRLCERLMMVIQSYTDRRGFGRP